MYNIYIYIYIYIYIRDTRIFLPAVQPKRDPWCCLVLVETPVDEPG